MKKNLVLLVLFAVLGGIAIWLYRKDSKSTLANQPLADFAIEDTAAINKIFITEANGASVLLERKPNSVRWTVNGKYLARQDAVDLLQLTFKQIKVRGNVPEKARENMMKVIASAGKKVEIYQGKDTPSKIYYIGTATPDHIGTYMLLEIPEIGRSEDPYITHMEGFTGFLSTRFFADETDWRYTGVFDFPYLDFTEVEMLDYQQPQNSFAVKYTGGNNIQIFTDFNPISGSFTTPIAAFDSSLVKEFLLHFKKVHFDSYRTNLNQHAYDSIAMLPPNFALRVTDNAGHKTKVDLIYKKSSKVYLDDNGQPSPWDLEYFWGRSETGELALAQTFVFSPLIQPLKFYLPKGQ